MSSVIMTSDYDERLRRATMRSVIKNERRGYEQAMSPGIGYMTECSIIAGGGGRIRGRKWYTLGRVFGLTVSDGLLFHDLSREGPKCTENSIPLFLTKVVNHVVHIPGSPEVPVLRIERLSRLNIFTRGIHLVCAFDLNMGRYQCGHWRSSDIAYRGSCKSKDTQGPVSGSWIFGWNGLHYTRGRVVA